MDGHATTPTNLKARKLRRVTLLRGRHAWHFVCAPGEEAQLLRSAAELARKRGNLRPLDLPILARQLGIDPETLNPPVRKAD